MQNHRLGIHNDKIRAKIPLKYLSTYLADQPNLPKYLGYLKKGFFCMSVVHTIAAAGKLHRFCLET